MTTTEPIYSSVVKIINGPRTGNTVQFDDPISRNVSASSTPNPSSSSSSSEFPPPLSVQEPSLPARVPSPPTRHSQSFSSIIDSIILVPPQPTRPSRSRQKPLSTALPGVIAPTVPPPTPLSPVPTPKQITTPRRRENYVPVRVSNLPPPSTSSKGIQASSNDLGSSDIIEYVWVNPVTASTTVPSRNGSSVTQKVPMLSNMIPATPKPQSRTRRAPSQDGATASRSRNDRRFASARHRESIRSKSFPRHNSSAMVNEAVVSTNPQPEALSQLKRTNSSRVQFSNENVALIRRQSSLSEDERGGLLTGAFRRSQRPARASTRSTNVQKYKRKDVAFDEPPMTSQFRRQQSCRADFSRGHSSKNSQRSPSPIKNMHRSASAPLLKPRAVKPVSEYYPNEVADYDESLFWMCCFCAVINPFVGIFAALIAHQAKYAYLEHNWSEYERLKRGASFLSCLGLFLGSGAIAMAGIKLYHFVNSITCTEKCSFLTNELYDFMNPFRDFAERELLNSGASSTQFSDEYS